MCHVVCDALSWRVCLLGIYVCLSGVDAYLDRPVDCVHGMQEGVWVAAGTLGDVCVQEPRGCAEGLGSRRFFSPLLLTWQPSSPAKGCAETTGQAKASSCSLHRPVAPQVCGCMYHQRLGWMGEPGARAHVTPLIAWPPPLPTAGAAAGKVGGGGLFWEHLLSNSCHCRLWRFFYRC